jgi:methylthioribose-1-phosphate isomerase
VKAQHIQYAEGVLRLLDQTRLPGEVVYLDLDTSSAVRAAIRDMRVRGAPAIGIVAAYGLALEARRIAARETSADSFMRHLETAAADLMAARPTAVNLSWSVSRLLERARQLLGQGTATKETAAQLEREAAAIHEEDVAACRAIGDHGAAFLKQEVLSGRGPRGRAAENGGASQGAGGRRLSILTHCNTGDLATGGYGTALGIIRSAWREGLVERVFVDETRPLLQGARLTVWELQRDGIPHVLIADAMAAHFMRRGEVDAIIVGADRIARNGDTANKIGTYGLALAARAHGIPFVVAAPVSTLDPAIARGEDIVIEERDPEEVRRFAGAQPFPSSAPVANPAFDVTPAEYVTAIVTERGVLRGPFEDAITALHAASSTGAGRDG